MDGVLKYWNSERGFGFIKPDDGGADVFCFVKNFNVGEDEIAKGMAVEFATQPNARDGKVEAVNIKVVVVH